MHVVDLEPHESLPALRHRQVDIALAYDYEFIAGNDTTDLHRVYLFTEPVLLLQALGAAATTPVALADYAERPWITRRPDTTCGLLVERACASVGFTPGAVACVADFGTASALAAAGVGVTLMPELGLTGDPRVAARPVIQPRLARRVYATARAGSESQPALNAVFTSIRSHAARARPRRAATAE